MFQRFTKPAREVVVLGQEEARTLGHEHIGTEHLLLGLLHHETSPTARALAGLGVTREAARDAVVAAVGSAEGRTIGELPFTQRAKHALEDALREALDRRDREIGPEHLLLGITRRHDSTAAKVLIGLGADRERVRTALGAAPRTDDGAALIALVDDDNGVAAQALAELGVSPDDVRAAVERVRGKR